MSRSDPGHVSRRLVLGGLASAAGQMAWGEAPGQSRAPLPRPGVGAGSTAAEIADILAQPGLTGRIGYVVADARNGRVLESHYPALPLPPASVAKTLTAQYALEALGPVHAFATQLVATGPVVAGRLEGDLVLVGGGDPTLDTDALARMIEALKGAGVRSVAGRFVVDGGLLPAIHEIDPGQPDYLGYNPSISGLNLNFNRVYFEWKKDGTGYDVTLDARSANLRPAITLARMAVIDRASPVYTYAEVGGLEQWTVARAALGKEGGRWLPVRRPADYAGEVLRSLALNAGVRLPAPVSGRAPIGATVLVSHASAPLQRMLRDMLAYSVNLTAEVTGLSATLAHGHNPTTLANSAAAMNLWAGDRLALRRPGLVDHSGLGEASRISAQDMVRVLLRTGPDSTLASILKPIPWRDERGNLAKNPPGVVRAKTGTLNFVSGLAGFIRVADRRDLAFAIFASDLDRRAAVPAADREKPRGASAWNVQARRMQRGLMERWAAIYNV